MEETRNVWENEELLNIVTVGHVDHGKSTVIGRLLADAGALPKGKLESIRENCRRNSKPFEYAFLLDALHNEQDQGITIDTARCFFKSDKRRYIIIDAPGHIEFLKNMVTGASRAEAALMVIDAARGVEENTRRHGYFLSMLGIRQVAVLVNKMDLVGYSEEVYRSIVTEFTEFLAKINISPAAFIPVSGMEGDNIAIRSERTPWYFGPTVLEQMDAFVPVPSPENRPLRMPVQGVYKFTEGGDERRIVAGTLEAGSLRAGDKIVFYPSGKKTTVASLEVFSAPTPEKFIAGDAAGGGTVLPAVVNPMLAVEPFPLVARIALVGALLGVFDGLARIERYAALRLIRRIAPRPGVDLRHLVIARGQVFDRGLPVPVDGDGQVDHLRVGVGAAHAVDIGLVFVDGLHAACLDRQFKQVERIGVGDGDAAVGVLIGGESPVRTGRIGRRQPVSEERGLRAAVHLLHPIGGVRLGCIGLGGVVPLHELRNAGLLRLIDQIDGD